AQCGGGGEFAFFYSPATTVAGSTRMVTYFQGGGMTFQESNGDFYTLANNLGGLKLLTTAPASANLATGIFMDRHPENEAFIGEAHWLFYPYCTQDFHAGRKSGPTTYDLMGTAFETEVETLLGEGQTPAAIEANFPGLDIVSVVGTDVTALTYSILHRGYLNFVASLGPLNDALEAAWPGVDVTDFLVSGGSAGSFGAILDFQLFGDLVWAFSPTEPLTLAPEGGFPMERRYNPATDALEEDPAFVDFLAAAFDSWDLILPCEIAGGAHVPSPTDRCTDILDLLDHYLARWPGLDIRYGITHDKEDPVIRGAFPWPGTPEDSTLDFCRTVHRYGQRMAERDLNAPWMHWQGTHVSGQAWFLTAMRSPSGAVAPSPYNLLGFLNGLAARSFSGSPVHIEHVFNTVDQPTNPDSAVTADPTHLPECNVPVP
ncbi:MAG: hypothetical protein KC466_12300, partial [Myxococcales bacterium]|nr:hypothetical protein [Myxococcales bacterium]